MASISINGDTSGAITVAAPAVAGTNTLTLPTLTQTLNVMGPAFSAYQSISQSWGVGAFTKVQLQTEEFDTNNNFDNTTNYRFTPTVAGYYQINGAAYSNGVGGQTVSIYKNGSEYKRGSMAANATITYVSVVSAIVYFNGSTDYVELYYYQNGAGTTTSITGQSSTYFNGCFLRGA